MVIVGITYFTYQKEKERTVDNYVLQGGLRKSVPLFTNYLEKSCEMTFLIDNGKSFTYSKPFNDINNNKGVLMIGVKLSMSNEPVLFSKFKSNYNGEYDGGDISGVNFNDVNTIKKCLDISFEVLKSKGVIALEHSNPKTLNSHKNDLAPKPKHKDMSTVTKNEYESVISELIYAYKFDEVKMMLFTYKIQFPDEKDRLIEFTDKISAGEYDEDYNDVIETLNEKRQRYIDCWFEDDETEIKPPR